MGPLSGGSNPTFCRAGGMAAAAGPTLPGTVCACKAHAPSKSAVTPTIWRTLFISLFLFLHRRCRRRGQSLFGEDLHRVLDGNLRDTAGLVDPLKLFIGLGVFLILPAQIGLRIGFMAGNTLQPRLRRQRSKILAKSLAGWRRSRIGRSRNIQGEAEAVNAHHQASHTSH